MLAAERERTSWGGARQNNPTWKIEATKCITPKMGSMIKREHNVHHSWLPILIRKSKSERVTGEPEKMLTAKDGCSSRSIWLTDGATGLMWHCCFVANIFSHVQASFIVITQWISTFFPPHVLTWIRLKWTFYVRELPGITQSKQYETAQAACPTWSAISCPLPCRSQTCLNTILSARSF